MKLKSTLLLLLSSVFIGLNAQVITDFEDGTTALATIAGAPSDQQAEFVMGADNPDKTGINSSDKCLYILSNYVAGELGEELPGRPQWNLNVFTITFEDTLLLTEDNRYLHIMHNKESILNEWLIYGEKGDSTYVLLGRGTTAEAGVWFDIVVDVKAALDSLKSIKVHLDGNWGGVYEPTKFYYDNIELSADITPRGADAQEFITRKNLLDFEDVTVTNATANPKTQNEAYTVDIDYTNSDISGVNTTSKCVNFTSNSLTPAWWHGIDFEFTSPVNSGENKYLHIMMKKSDDASAATQVSLFNANGTQSGALMSTPLTAVWVDYVMEIPSSHAIFNRLFIKFNAGADIACFADEILINTDPEPRVAMSTRLNENKQIEAFELYQKQGNIVFNSRVEKTICIYDISGKLVHNSRTKSVSVNMPQSGVYIVKVDSEVRKLVVN